MISIIMSVYNEELDWIKQSTLSILNQDTNDFEFLVVIDNPERHDIIEWFKSITDYRLSYFVNNQNMGLIYSLNFLINKSSGDFIARMDADDIACPNRLSYQLNYLKENNLDLIGSNVTIIDAHSEIMYKSNKIIDPNYIDKILQIGTVPLIHPTYLGKAHVFKQCLYNPDALYAEDMEFIAHARSMNYKIGNSPDFLLQYRFNELGITKSNAYISYQTAQNVKNAFRHFQKTGNYAFTQQAHTYTSDMTFRFNVRQQKMNLAKKEITNKKIFKGFSYLLEAMCADYKSFFHVIYINLMQSFYTKKSLKR